MRPLLFLCGAILGVLCVFGHHTYGEKRELKINFTRHPQPLAAPLGDEVYFECSLDLAAEKFAWRHRPLDSDKWEPFIHISNSSGKTSRYVVTLDDESKAGDYRCIASYGELLWLASDPARLSLAMLDEFTDRHDQVIVIAAQNTIPISCPIPHSVPEAIVQYYKNDQLVENATITESSKALVIENAKPSDSGRYHCLANNYITSQSYLSRHKTVLTVQSNPNSQSLYLIKPPPSEYRVLRGKNVSLECFAVGFPVPRVTWSKLGSRLPEKAVNSSMGLTISNVQPLDRGEYDCMWSNGVQKIKSVIILTVVEPPKVVESPRSSTFAEGGELELSCVFLGNPEPNIEWLINGETLFPSKHLEMKRSGMQSTLIISLVEKKHAGIVQCIATNEYGSHSGYNVLSVTPKQHMGNVAESRLEYGLAREGHKHSRNGGGRRRGKDGRRKGNVVLIPPGQPNVTRLSDVSVMVRWSVPENSGLPIQFFKVQYRELGQKVNGKQTKWMTANTEIPNHVRSFQVTDLQPNHTYRFRIAAVYSNNDNKLSQNSVRFYLNGDNGFESNKMPIPLLTNTEALGPHQVLLVWQNPDRSTDIDGFYVYHRASTSAGDYIKTTVEGRNATNITISHLQPDTTYEFKLQSFSVDAASEFSKLLVQRTKKMEQTVPPQVVAENKLKPLDNSSKSNMFAIIGGVLGGATVLGLLAAVGFAYKRSKQKQLREVTQNQAKPMTNGRVMNGGPADSKMNITSNPLAGIEPTEDPSVQPKSGQQPSMEMASFLNGQNNNSAQVAPGINSSRNEQRLGRQPHEQPL